jgi:hypothetical protein
MKHKLWEKLEKIMSSSLKLEQVNYINNLPLPKKQIKKIAPYLDNKLLFSLLNVFNRKLKSTIKKLRVKTLCFFNSLKINPEFITLDTAFINNPNQETYSNLINFIILRNDEFKKTLNENLKITTTLMDDNHIPMYNSSLNIKDNSFYNYINGNIVFDSKSEYITGIKSLQQGYSEENLKFRGIIFSEKIGQTMQEKYEITGASLLGAAVALFLLLIKFQRYLSKDSINYLILLLFLLIIIGLLTLLDSNNSN